VERSARDRFAHRRCRAGEPGAVRGARDLLVHAGDPRRCSPRDHHGCVGVLAIAGRRSARVAAKPPGRHQPGCPHAVAHATVVISAGAPAVDRLRARASRAPPATCPRLTCTAATMRETGHVLRPLQRLLDQRLRGKPSCDANWMSESTAGLASLGMRPEAGRHRLGGEAGRQEGAQQAHQRFIDGPAAQ